MTLLYRDMNQAQLDAAYNNTAAVPDFPGIYAALQARSTDFYASVAGRLDLPYGTEPRQRYDWLPCGKAGAPTFVFIHGGYWQNCTKEDFAFVANGPLTAGFNVVLAEYTLAPQASMTQIVSEIGSLLEHLRRDADHLGIAGHKVVLSGHSAGGHLALQFRSHPWVTDVLAISALVDLKPISLTWLNEKLKLSAAEIEAYSPLHHIGKGAPTWVTVGAAELPELVRQSDEYAQQALVRGESVQLVHVPGCTHFSVLDEMAKPQGALLQALSSIG
ncbi:esterase [Pseudomonas chlororaphis subsp. aurantiaca]|uniref:alpha/beta hydrolase n=1 Tax=Pseudomonas chlororaphis TaxID=587753 RepID=UPI00050D7C89|nr:alpha/beta hydrolase [Pseudomonas chlororaphis]AIS14128.1 esterase [Pseudomonas chlororaphis subsp. aurantiaca]